MATSRRLSVYQAAQKLRTTPDAVRGRIKRGTIKHVHEEGRAWVVLAGDRSDTNRDQQTDQHTDQREGRGSLHHLFGGADRLPSGGTLPGAGDQQGDAAALGRSQARYVKSAEILTELRRLVLDFEIYAVELPEYDRDHERRAKLAF